MENIKNFINETKNSTNIKYVFVSHNSESKADIKAYVDTFETIDEIEDLFYDWEYDDNEVNDIINKVKKLKINESYIDKMDDGSFNIVIRIK